jgi:hypothetical protein
MFNYLIDEFNWNAAFENCNNVSEACEFFTKKYTDFAKTCIPIKTVTIRPTDKPWFSSELYREIRRRDRLHKIMRRTNKEDDILRFKRQRYKVNKMKKYARLSFYGNVSGLIDQYSKLIPRHIGYL